MHALALSLWLLLSTGGDLDERELQQLAAPMEATGDDATLRRLVDSFYPRVARVMGASTSPSFQLKLVSRKEAAERLEAVLHREYPGDRLDRLGVALEAVHLLEPGTHLAQEAAQLYGKNVSGFYDPHDRALYLIRDQPMISQAMIVPHELAHAVQDAQLRLESAMNARRDSEDATLALSAAVEGNAQAVASAVLAEGSAGDESASMLSALSESVGESAEAAALQSDASPWLGMQLHFPYSAGLKLVEAARGRGDASGMQLLRRLPDSTAQVLAPALYFQRERPLEARGLGLAGKVNGRAVYETTLGRANLDLFGQLHADGAPLGEGWRGDRLEVARVGSKVCAVWMVTFGKPSQAERLAAAYAHLTGARPTDPGRFASGDTVVRVQGTTVAIVENGPGDQLPQLEMDALAAFPAL